MYCMKVNQGLSSITTARTTSPVASLRTPSPTSTATGRSGVGELLARIVQPFFVS